MNNWQEVMQGSKGFALKKFMVQILKDKIVNYDDLLTRISHNLVTENDTKQFAQMVNEIIMYGYNACDENYKKQLKDMGIQITQN